MCHPGYEMSHRYCQRIDRIASNAINVVKSIKMQDDFLDDSSPSKTKARVGNDNLIVE